MIHVCVDESATEALGAALAERLLPAGVLLLEGDLGAGKTVLVRGLAAALGIDGVQSPTFTLIHEHQGERASLVHVDLYRLEPADVPALGLDEHFASPGIVAVEWPDRLEADPPGALRAVLRARADGVREIEID